jgi:hypothetical protein
MFYLKKPKIDSLRLFIPMERVEVHNPALTQNFVRYYQDIDQFNDVVEKPKPISEKGDDGISQRFYICNPISGKEKNQVPSLCVHINAKMLKDKYFQGITASNAKDVYDFLMECGHVSFSFDDFLNAKYTDTDICYDNQLTERFLKPTVLKIKNKVIYPNYLTYRSSGTGTTLKFNTRENAKPTKPHIQMYDKTAELEFSSFKFKNKYLKGLDIPKSILRLEFTMKSSKHRQKLGLEAKTFKDLLTASDDQLKSIISSGIPKYTHKMNKNPRTGLGVNDTILNKAFELMMVENKMGLDSFLSLTDGITDKVKRSKCRKKIRDIYDSVQEEDIKSQNEEIDAYLKDIGLL